MTRKIDLSIKKVEKSNRYANPYQNSALLGRIGEDVAVKYLEEAKYKILARNWRSRMGEIDIIGLQNATKKFCGEKEGSMGGVVAFIEVKTRQSDYEPARIGDFVFRPGDAVHRQKQNRLKNLADQYLRKEFEKVIEGEHLGEWYFRFDVVEVILYEGYYSVFHNENVFS